MSNLKRIQVFILDNLIWFISIIYFLAFGAIYPRFISWGSISLILVSMGCLSFLVYGQGILLISGNLDLSLAQIGGFSAALVALMYTRWAPGLPGWTSIFVICIIGAALGAINGLFVGKLEVNPFLITLSTYFIYRWLRFYFLRSTVLAHQLPHVFISPGGNKVLGLGIPIFISIGVLIILYILLDWTRFGTRIYAIGGDAFSSFRQGISVPKVTLIVFALAGVLGAVGAMLYSGYSGGVTPQLIDGYIFLSFAGAIIGGTSLHGGRGKIQGMLGGVLFITMVDIGLQTINMDSFLRMAMRGLLILVAVLVNRYRERMLDNILQG